jgi:hypothetical protein
MTSSEVPLLLWTGWDARRSASSADVPAGNPFAPPALDGSDAESHYELIAVAARGFRPPTYLSTVDVDGAAQVEDVASRGYAGLKQTWSLLYRQIAETGPSAVAPYGIYLLGVNPPEDANDADLEVFNDFYTNGHMPEVAERRHALRAVRYELVHAVRPPYQGAPRFLAVYEVDEAGATSRRHTGPPYAKGPDVWQRHTTPWRLWYRRLPTDD